MGRKRKKRSITLKNIYYKYDYRYNPKHPYYCTQKDYINISKDFYKILSSVMIEEGFSFHLPLKLGEIRIVKFRSDKPHIDWKLTNEYFKEWNINNPHDRKRIYHKNIHTEGFAARFHWKKATFLKYQTMYNFEPVRNNKRTLAKSVKENDTIYLYNEY